MKIICFLIVFNFLGFIDLGKNEKFTHLKNNQTDFIVIEFFEKEVRCHDPILKKKMEDQGVSIPLSERTRYEGKECIFLHDKLFYQAFREFYYPYAFGSDSYNWE